MKKTQKKVITKCNNICNASSKELVLILWDRFKKALKESGKAAAFAIHH